MLHHIASFVAPTALQCDIHGIIRSPCVSHFLRHAVAVACTLRDRLHSCCSNSAISSVICPSVRLSHSVCTIRVTIRVTSAPTNPIFRSTDSHACRTSIKGVLGPCRQVSFRVLPVAPSSTYGRSFVAFLLPTNWASTGHVAVAAVSASNEFSEPPTVQLLSSALRMASWTVSHDDSFFFANLYSACDINVNW